MFREKIRGEIQKMGGGENISLEVPEIETHGDYSTNLAMVLAKKEGKNPQRLAKEQVGKLQKDSSLSKIISKIEVKGPGFVNFWLSEEALLKNLEEIVNEGGKYGSAALGKGKTVIVEYSSPNIAKAFGIGHLRSTIIGQSLYNLYKALGCKVIGDNHLGDWGTQFGTLLYQIDNQQLAVNKLSVAELEELYVDFNKKAEDDPKLWDEARAWFKRLEEGDKKAREIWEKAREISLEEFDRIYKLLGVTIDNAYGESFYENKMFSIIEDIRKRGLSKKSQGAEIIEFKDLPPAMLIKGDGATTYYTRDLATVKFRVEKFQPDVVIYEVGADQILHFRQVFETARLLGWDKGRELVHIAHGLIRFEHGKMSTRRGETIKLEDVLNEAIDRAREIIEKSETSRGLSDKEKEEVAKAVGIGAVKYFDLKHHPATDIIFDWEKMFVLEGNSAPYLQYTFARTQSVLAKSKRVKEQESKSKLELNHEEIVVLRSLVHFQEVIENAAESYAPNLLCNYLFDLAQKFNAFYARHRILNIQSGRVEEPLDKAQGKQESRSLFRIMLTKGAGCILKNGLTLLGISTPVRM